MLQIRCPYCGVRDEVEFSFGGESDVNRPALSADGKDWAHYLFYRNNAKGSQRERWYHRFGCGRWFEVQRNTVTHEITEVFELGSSEADT